MAFGVTLGPIFSAYDFGPAAISWMGSGIILTGVISSFGVGFLINKYYCFRILLRISSFGTCISFFFTIFSLISMKTNK